MNRDDLVRMAREAGSMDFGADSAAHVMNIDVLERFAAEVAAAEREKCAKVGDELAANWWNLRSQMNSANERRHLHSKVHGAEQVSAAIRARGKQ